ncbi:hypothetical protein B0T19DRAFT_163651 [Cercophora scortea]|uniref:Uncharacterized protein n=1 Tax=Cercophora scortea TaxID=314031 RepID=A0AAE0MDV7_9PEZI|nr:hypothetical protein B0T19DRAFT_163651 [Cercophora scortea]
MAGCKSWNEDHWRFTPLNFIILVLLVSVPSVSMASRCNRLTRSGFRIFFTLRLSCNATAAGQTDGRSFVRSFMQHRHVWTKSRNTRARSRVSGSLLKCRSLQCLFGWMPRQISPPAPLGRSSWVGGLGSWRNHHLGETGVTHQDTHVCEKRNSRGLVSCQYTVGSQEFSQEQTGKKACFAMTWWPSPFPTPSPLACPPSPPPPDIQPFPPSHDDLGRVTDGAAAFWKHDLLEIMTSHSLALKAPRASVPFPNL